MEAHPHDSIDTVFNIVIPYIDNGDDRNTISLVCRKWYEIDCMTREHVTVHVVYSRQPSHVVYSRLPLRVAQRFPYLKSLTLKGLPRAFKTIQYIDLTPWIHEIVYSFKCLKSLDIRRVILRDSDIEQIARRRGKDLRVLKISNCKGVKGNGFIHIGRYCNGLRTLCLEDNQENQSDRKWLHELALNNTRIESLKTGTCNLSDLRYVFSHAVNLIDFACCELENFEQEGDQYARLKFPPNMRIRINRIDQIVLPFVLPLSDRLRELNIRHLNEDSQCFLIQRCPNLEALYINNMLGDNVLQVIGQSCKKLCKFKTTGKAVTQFGLITLAQGCIELECLHINSAQLISNESLECIGRCLKNLNDFQITLPYIIGGRMSILDSGIRAMLIGCSKLERLRINHGKKRLRNTSLEYIGKHGHNLKYLSLDFINSSDVDSGIRDMLIGCSKLESLTLNDCCRDLTNVGLGYIAKYGHNLRHLSLVGHYLRDCVKGFVELSKCRRLRKLVIHDCFFSKQVLSTLMFNSESLRYMWVLDRDENIVLAKTRYKWVVDRNYEGTLLAKTGRV